MTSTPLTRPREIAAYIDASWKAALTIALSDLDVTAAGGSALRIVVSDFEVPRASFLEGVRAAALQRGLVVATGALDSEHRLHSTNGHARALYTQLVKGLETSSSRGSALEPVLCRLTGISKPELQQRLGPIVELVHGYEFFDVVEKYLHARETGDEPKASAALSWLRAELTSKAAARRLLGVSSVIEDSWLVNALTLLTRLVRIAGYSGLLLVIDNLDGIGHLNHQARSTSHIMLKFILNEVRAVNAPGLGVLFSGTTASVLDNKTGLHAAEQLRVWLTDDWTGADASETGPRVLRV
jgi:hypothetical protein